MARLGEFLQQLYLDVVRTTSTDAVLKLLKLRKVNVPVFSCVHCVKKRRLLALLTCARAEIIGPK